MMKLQIIISILFSVTALGAPLRQQIEDAARAVSLDPDLVQAVIRAESNFNKKAVSPKGAMGLMQVMPNTASEIGIRNSYHVTNHLMGACRYLRKMVNRYRGDIKLALAAYNSGPRNVDRHHGIPPFKETQQYVKRVLSYYDKLKEKKRKPPTTH